MENKYLKLHQTDIINTKVQIAPQFRCHHLYFMDLSIDTNLLYDVSDPA